MMLSLSKWILLSCFIAIFSHMLLRQSWKNFLRTNLLSSLKDDSTSQRFELIIGILSSQPNFIQRDTIRKTWLSTLNASISAKAWFVVARHPCTVPMPYRLTEYECTWWQYNISAIKAAKSFTSGKVENVDNCTYNHWQLVYQGFSFQVHYPVVVTRLGVLAEVISNTSNVTVALLNGPTKEVVVSAMISSENDIHIEGFIYHSVQPYVLPKGFEGIVLVEGTLASSACVRMEWSSGNGLLTFKRAYHRPEDYNTFPFSPDYAVAPSFIFLVPNHTELTSLESNRMNAAKEWKKSLQLQQLQLNEEMDKYNDIFLVDVVEVYRNLPAKLLKFLSWLTITYNFSYFLKSDDDCIIDLRKLVNELKSLSRYNPEKRWWWSRFRHQWAVNYFGKWADYDYSSVAYPSFPCGGGYVLSSKTVEWISKNSNYLHYYQGEDVSMGIWLSAINPERFEDDRWNCQEGCQSNSFNRVQLSVSELRQSWSSHKKCGSLCKCNYQ